VVNKVPLVGKAAQALRRLYDWMGTLVHRPWGVLILALFFFVEAIVILPAGPMLVLFCSERPKRSFFYALVATIFSVLGGIAAYHIGLYVWEQAGQKIVAWVTTPEKFNYLCTQYQIHSASAILIAGLTPLPFKVITLTAGFCRVPLVPFIVCSFIVRSIRLFLIGTVMFTWGAHIKSHIDRYFNSLVVLFVVIVLCVLFAIT